MFLANKEPTTVESIVAHLQSEGEIKLPTAAAEEKLKRLISIDKLYSLYKLPGKVYPMHIFQFDVSLSTAKRDLRDMKMVFGKVSYLEKEYERHAVMEWVKEAAHKALAEKKYSAFIKAMELYRRYGQFDEIEENLPQQDLEPHVYVFTNADSAHDFPEIPNLEAAKQRIRKRRVLKLQGIEDIDSEEVEDEN